MPQLRPALLNRLSVFFFLFLLPLSIFAQDRKSITGIILSETNGPILGVNITWQNKGISSISNSDGKFVILIPPTYSSNDSLTFSCIGYKVEKIKISDAVENKALKVMLIQNVVNLKEVVIKIFSVKQLLDSIKRRNKEAFISPMILNGYYREFVYSNAKCTEYADAICEYFYDRNLNQDGQLKIGASRCLKAKKDNEDKNNMEVYKDSKVDPNIAFKYSLFSAMVDKFLSEKTLNGYKYNIQEASEKDNTDLKISVFPKNISGENLYSLTMILNSDFKLKSYKLEIPDTILAVIKEKSMLGIHSKVTKFIINVNYSSIGNQIFPNYYSINRNSKIWGKFLGTTINQTIDNKSEFIGGELIKTGIIKPFDKQDVYKKGNICNNGASINEALLKKYTIILPSQDDSISIQSLSN
jgi:hypothetical protein